MSEDKHAMSYFASPAWEPVCVVGSQHNGHANAQISVSVFNASIVPDRPRLLALLWKSNLTHDLAAASRSLSITLLTAGQVGLLEALGLRSGRDGDKLGDVNHQVTDAGNPYFPDGASYVECRVVDAYDLGDATAFLCQVDRDEALTTGEPITWADAKRLAGEEFAKQYEAKFARDADVSRAAMKWL